MRKVFTADDIMKTEKCKFDNTIKRRAAAAVVLASLNLSRNSSKEKHFNFCSKFTLKIKCGKSKGMQEKCLSWM